MMYSLINSPGIDADEVFSGLVDSLELLQFGDEYTEGRVAARRGEKKENCPHTTELKSESRKFWLEGWDDKKNEMIRRQGTDANSNINL